MTELTIALKAIDSPAPGRKHLRHAPVGVIWPGEVIIRQGCRSAIVRSRPAAKTIAVARLTKQDTGRYGVFSPSAKEARVCIPATAMVVKTSRGQAPSTLAAVGRTILQPMISDVLDHTPKGAGETRFSRPMPVPVSASPFRGRRFGLPVPGTVAAPTIAGFRPLTLVRRRERTG